jgi:hypothetical protein
MMVDDHNLLTTVNIKHLLKSFLLLVGKPSRSPFQSLVAEPLTWMGHVLLSKWVKLFQRLQYLLPFPARFHLYFMPGISAFQATFLQDLCAELPEDFQGFRSHGSFFRTCGSLFWVQLILFADACSLLARLVEDVKVIVVVNLHWVQLWFSSSQGGIGAVRSQRAAVHHPWGKFGMLVRKVVAQCCQRSQQKLKHAMLCRQMSPLHLSFAQNFLRGGFGLVGRSHPGICCGVDSKAASAGALSGGEYHVCVLVYSWVTKEQCGL